MSATKPRFRWKRLLFSAGVVGLAVAAPGARGWASKREQTRDRQQVIEDLCRLRNDIDGTIATTGRYPRTWSEVGIETPLDPWGNPYRLVLRRPSGQLGIDCWGANGAPGGSGPDADLSAFQAKLLR